MGVTHTGKEVFSDTIVAEKGANFCAWLVCAKKICTTYCSFLKVGGAAYPPMAQQSQYNLPPEIGVNYSNNLCQFIAGVWRKDCQKCAKEIIRSATFNTFGASYPNTLWNKTNEGNAGLNESPLCMWILKCVKI